jgi:hypothetical protein
MPRLFYAPSWWILKLAWPFFSIRHEWKVSRKKCGYKCYTLNEWSNFVKQNMKQGDKIFMDFFINGQAWLIIIFTFLAVAISVG